MEQSLQIQGYQRKGMYQLEIQNSSTCVFVCGAGAAAAAAY